MNRFDFFLILLLSLCCQPVAFAGPDSVVTFNEVHYHPESATAPEWLELHNQMSIRVDLSGWTLRGGIAYTFPENSILEPGAMAVISSGAGTPAGSFGPFTGRLDNKGEEIRLHGRHGRLMDRISYGDDTPWPAGPDGQGPSLAKLSPNSLSDDPGNWQASGVSGGTPGLENFSPAPESSPRDAAYAGTAWRYLVNEAPAAPEWTQVTGFDDSAWSTGAAPFSTMAPAGTPLPPNLSAVFFRKSFGYIGGIDHAALLLTGFLQGDARIYLNGNDAGGFSAAGNFAITVPSGILTPGSNLLALRLTPSPGQPAGLDLALTIIDDTTSVPPPAEPHIAGAVVINEISYHAPPRYADPLNGISFAENAAEWIEFHNRGPVPADLTGWRLRGGADYDFPAGSLIAPGGFLVLDRTQFSGSMSNKGDTLNLRNAAGETVDKIRYFDGGRWPDAADGGGSTLELTDPSADNRIPESWAASDESARTSWQTVTYRASGAEPAGSKNPTNWHEFLFGLLDAGEVLIDDVSVLEDPDGTRLQLIQNGNFESDSPGSGAAHWRLLGTHRLSRVVAVENGKALHLTATAELEHTYNCASTTLAGNRAPQSGKTYEISYRARWLSGSPQLNSRLYLNRAARTVILPLPAVHGTPGAPNSQLRSNTGPSLTGLRHSPLVPETGQPVRVSLTASDPDGIREVRLHYSVNEGAWRTVPMGGNPRGTYFGVIPGQPLNALVRFYAEAADGSGAKSWFPPAGPDSRALFRVGDGGVSTQPVSNRLRLLMTAGDATDLHNPVHSVSNFRHPCTVIYNDREVWYDARVRLRSAPFGRQGSRAGWNISFGPDAPFRGVQKSIVIDGAFNMPKTDGTGWLENTTGPSVNEMLFQAIANRAGDIPASYDDVVYFQAPRAGENRRAQLKMTRFGSGYLEELMPDGDKGILYKQELIYYPTATVDGNPESLKNPYNAVLDTEIRRFGNPLEGYRFNYLLQNHADRNDFTPILALGTAFDSTSTALPAATAAAMDIDNWMRVHALIALTGLADTYNNSLAHNIQLFARPDDGRVMLFPWDQDHAFYYSSVSSIFGAATHRLKDIIQIPANRRLYCAHLLDLCGDAFTNQFLDPVINHLHTVAGRDSYAALIRSWVSRRNSYVTAQVRALYGAVPFSITTNGGAPVTVTSPALTVEGRGSIDVREIRMTGPDGVTRTPEVTWLDSSRWRITAPALPGTGVLTFTAIDRTGAQLGSSAITVTNTGDVFPASAANLVLSEIDYHPPGVGQEFVELMNSGNTVIDLAGIRFTAGIRFDFPISPPVPLQPGARLLLVQDRIRFAERHGTGWPVAGEFSALTQLANGGDRITLRDAFGGVILDFAYGDAFPWPSEADGGGYTLTRLLTSSAAPEDPAAWRTSRFPGGSPGESDTLSLDSFSSLIDFALISAPAPLPGPAERRAVWSARIGADSVRIVPEVSRDLVTWLPDPGDGTMMETLSVEVEDGASVVTVRLPEDRPFLRLRIQPR